MGQARIASLVPPLNRPLRVAAYPAWDAASTHPYLQLLHRALERHGVSVVQSPRLDRRLAKEPALRPDLVHLHWVEFLAAGGDGQGASARAAVRTARLLGVLQRLRRHGVGVVWTAHNLRPHESRHRTAEEVTFRGTARLAHRVIAHSQHARQRVADAYGHADKIAVVPIGNFMGVYPPPARSRAQIRADLGIPSGAFVFLLFGQIRPYKRIPETVAAFRALPRDDVALVVAGEARDSALRAQIEREAAGDRRVHCRLTRVADHEVAALHEAADAAVLGYREIFSSGALLLALSFGLPVVVPDNGSALEAATSEAVRTFGPGGLTDALGAMADTDTRPARAAALAAAERADWDTIASSTVAVYRDALARAHATARSPRRTLTTEP